MKGELIIAVVVAALVAFALSAIVFDLQEMARREARREGMRQCINHPTDSECQALKEPR
jgi:hypothetical protein